jgi:hypothetical protein
VASVNDSLSPNATTGFVFLQEPIASSLLTDPLFPHLRVEAVLLFRKVDLCQPGALSEPPSYRRDIQERWIDESELVFSATSPRPAHLPASLNFSANPTIANLTLSRSLLSSGVMQMHLIDFKVSVPDSYKRLSNGVYFHSATADFKGRKKSTIEAGRLDVLALLGRVVHMVVKYAVINDLDLPSMLDFDRLSPDEAVDAIIEKCLPGDVLIRHYVFRPSNVSIVAWRSGRKLTTKAVGDQLIGVVRGGQIDRDRMFDHHVAAFEGAFQSAKVVLTVLWILAVLKGVPSRATRMRLFAASAWLIGFVRAVMWRGGWLRPAGWLALVVMLGVVA